MVADRTVWTRSGFAKVPLVYYNSDKPPKEDSMLKRITTNDSLQRLYISVHQSTLDMLQAYRENYRQVYGDELPQNRAIEAMLVEFMTNDKDFQRFLKTWKPAEPGTNEAPRFSSEPQLSDSF